MKLIKRLKIYFFVSSQFLSTTMVKAGGPLPLLIFVSFPSFAIAIIKLYDTPIASDTKAWIQHNPKNERKKKREEREHRGPSLSKEYLPR